MEQELLAPNKVLALGYHLDGFKSDYNATEADDSLSKLTAFLPISEKNRIDRVASLCRKYAKVLSWARRERLLHSSSTCRILASQIEKILLSQVVKASSIQFLTINDIYIALWELETIVDLFDKFLVSQLNLNEFLSQILQEALTIDRKDDSVLTRAKYSIFKEWISLQRKVFIAWISSSQLPFNPQDFWIVHHSFPQNNQALNYNNIDTNIDANQIGQNSSIWEEYSILESQLPSLLIPLPLAKKILFIGIAVKILSTAKMLSKENQIWLIEKVSEIFDFASNKTDQMIQEHDNMNERDYKSDVYDNESNTSCSGSWNTIRATLIVDQMFSWAANALYTLLIEKNHFHVHLQILREYYFLQDGLFYGTFFSLASKRLFLTQPGLNAEHDINLLFQESSASKQYLGEDIKSSFFQKLKLTFNPSFQKFEDINAKIQENDTIDSTGSAKKALPLIWSDICLDYQTQWPINLLLSNSTLSKYNQIFQFLFQVKRIQLSLQQQWIHGNPRNLKQTKENQQTKTAKRFIMLRHQMGFFLDTINQYLHIDVFSSEIEAFDIKMASCKGYEDLAKAHEHFLNQITMQCFLNVSAFKRAFNNVFDIISSFCTLMNQFFMTSTENLIKNANTNLKSTKNELDDDQFNVEFEKIAKEWSKQTSFLFTLLSGVKGQAPHLSKLLLLMGYSLFWSYGKSFLELEKDANQNVQNQRNTRNLVRQTSSSIVNVDLQRAAEQVKQKPQETIVAKKTSTEMSSTTKLVKNTNQSNPPLNKPAGKPTSSVAPKKQPLKTPSTATSSSTSGAKKVAIKQTSSVASTSMSKAALAPRKQDVVKKREKDEDDSDSETKPKETAGPRPELLARLMKKTNK